MRQRCEWRIVFSLGKRKHTPMLGEDNPRYSWKTLPPADPMEHVTYIAIPECDLPALVKRYAKAMETEESKDWCTCQWIIHPDDVNVKANECRVCGYRKDARTHAIVYANTGIRMAVQAEGVHSFKGRRMRLGDQSPDCPAHTKEGLVLYFFRWVFKNG